MIEYSFKRKVLRWERKWLPVMQPLFSDIWRTNYTARSHTTWLEGYVIVEDQDIRKRRLHDLKQILSQFCEDVLPLCHSNIFDGSSGNFVALIFIIRPATIHLTSL